jgi:hypothetical protein
VRTPPGLLFLVLFLKHQLVLFFSPLPELWSHAQRRASQSPSQLNSVSRVSFSCHVRHSLARAADASHFTRDHQLPGAQARHALLLMHLHPVLLTYDCALRKRPLSNESSSDVRRIVFDCNRPPMLVLFETPAGYTIFKVISHASRVLCSGRVLIFGAGAR